MNGMHNHSQLHNWLCVVASLPLTLTLLWTWKLDWHSGRLLKLCLVSRVLCCESIYWHQFATNDWEWWMLFSELVSLNVPKKKQSMFGLFIVSWSFLNVWPNSCVISQSTATRLHVEIFYFARQRPPIWSRLSGNWCDQVVYRCFFHFSEAIFNWTPGKI